MSLSFSPAAAAGAGDAAAAALTGSAAQPAAEAATLRAAAVGSDFSAHLSMSKVTPVSALSGSDVEVRPGRAGAAPQRTATRQC
jgi:hypothetical protein